MNRVYDTVDKVLRKLVTPDLLTFVLMPLVEQALEEYYQDLRINHCLVYQFVVVNLTKVNEPYMFRDGHVGSFLL